MLPDSSRVFAMREFFVLFSMSIIFFSCHLPRREGQVGQNFLPSWGIYIV